MAIDAGVFNFIDQHHRCVADQGHIADHQGPCLSAAERGQIVVKGNGLAGQLVGCGQNPVYNDFRILDAPNLGVPPQEGPDRGVDNKIHLLGDLGHQVT
jgi:hypothetical protein